MEPYDEEDKVVGWKMCDVAVGACAKFAKHDCDVSHV